VLLADNTLWKGKIVSPQDDSDRAIVKFNDHVQNDSRVESVMLTIRDGVTLAFKR
jgi:caffeoyl-CoA O-methyltransferase